MSAFALASQDFAGSGSVAAPMAFSARKNAREALDGENSGESFDAALARSENETPATASPDADATSPLVASPSAARAASAIAAFADADAAPEILAGDDALWRDLPVVSATHSATAHSTASTKGSTHASVAAGEQAEKSAGAAVGPSTAAAADEDESASARQIDWKALVPSLVLASGTLQASGKMAPTPAEKASPASKKTIGANEADSSPTRSLATSAAPTTPTPAPDPLAGRFLEAASPSSSPSQAKAIVSSGDRPDVSASTGEGAEADSVARIGAALASVSRRATTPGVVDQSSTDARISLATPGAATTSPVHLVAQQAWLQPVSPAFSPGLKRLAAADRAALEAPPAVKAPSDDVRDPTASADVADAAPTPDADDQSPASIGLSFSGRADPVAEADFDGAAPTAKMSAHMPANAGVPLAATPRRDLEITMAPKNLGGLEVRMKSAGDRLEIAFVADKGETARMISDKSATLESQLHGAGLGLGGIDINAAAKMESGAVSTLPASAGTSANGAPAHSRGNSENASQRQDSSSRGRQDQRHETGERTSEPRASSGDRGLYL